MTSDISRTSIMDYLATNWPEVDLALILARTIDSIKTDPSQLRNTVYELARTKLLREASERGQPISILALPRLMLAFETAIERVERQASRQDELRALQSIAQLVSPVDDANAPKRDHFLSLIRRPGQGRLALFRIVLRRREAFCWPKSARGVCPAPPGA